MLDRASWVATQDPAWIENFDRSTWASASDLSAKQCLVAWTAGA